MIDSTIDDLDLKILNELGKNARLSFAEVGRLVGLSPSAARGRMQKMEDQGVINGYRVELDQRMLGYDIEAFISVKVFHGKLKPFLEVLKYYPEVKRAFRVTGGQNLQLEVIARDRLELQHLIDRLMEYGDTLTQLVLSEVVLDG